MGREPVLGPAGRRLGQPRVLHHLGQLLQRELADPAGPQQHGGVAVEVRRGEERRGVVLDQGELVGLAADPEDDDVLVALAGVGVDRVRARVAEEDEGLAADLVDGVVLVPGWTLTCGMAAASSCTSATRARRVRGTVTPSRLGRRASRWLRRLGYSAPAGSRRGGRRDAAPPGQLREGGPVRRPATRPREAQRAQPAAGVPGAADHDDEQQTIEIAARTAAVIPSASALSPTTARVTASDHCWMLEPRAPGTRQPNTVSQTSA